LRAPDRIDFVAAPPLPRLGSMLALLATAAVLALGIVGWQRLQAVAAVVAATPSARPALGRASATADDADRRLHAQLAPIAARLEAPWFELLATFEQHTGNDVGLLRLQPDARQMRIRVHAQARDVRAMLAYVSALEADPRLLGVLLISHQTEAEVPGRPVSFELQAGWRRVPTQTMAKGPLS
jgi:hypothetical protein